MWLQSLDVSEATDHPSHNGRVLTSKLFGPPQLKAVQFDVPANSLNEKESASAAASKAVNSSIANALMLAAEMARSSHSANSSTVDMTDDSAHSRKCQNLNIQFVWFANCTFSYFVCNDRNSRHVVAGRSRYIQKQARSGCPRVLYRSRNYSRRRTKAKNRYSIWNVLLFEFFFNFFI